MVDRQHERQRALYWADVLGSRPLSGISVEDLRHHQQNMLARGYWTHATINRYFSALRRILSLAVDDGKLDRHAMKGIRFLPEPQTDRFFTDDELASLRRLMKPDAWNRVLFAVETCLRASEQFTLEWKHVDLEAKTLTIPLPKGNKTRRVPVSETALHVLRSVDSLESGWVFPHHEDSSKHRHPYHEGRQFARILRKAGIQGASWHTLRHTGASRRLRAGVDIVTVSKILGHSTIQTTMRYLHLVETQLTEAINKGSVQLAEIEQNPVRNRDLNRDQPSILRETT